MIIDRDLFARECSFRTSRSGGKGGQNVNKVETKVELLFDIQTSSLFTDEEKATLLQKLAARITDNVLQVTAEKERSQLQNKELAIDKTIRLIEQALKPVKPRKATKPTKQSVEQRLSNKQLKSMKKELRKRLF